MRSDKYLESALITLKATWRDVVGRRRKEVSDVTIKYILKTILNASHNFATERSARVSLISERYNLKYIFRDFVPRKNSVLSCYLLHLPSNVIRCRILIVAQYFAFFHLYFPFLLT